MPKKTEEEYWLARAQARILATDRDANIVKADQDKAYHDAREKVRREIDKFYCNFGNAAGMSAEEARQKLSRIDLKDFKDELERKRSIIKKLIAKDPNNDELKRYDEELEKLSKVRELTRKEALEANIAAEIAQLGGKQQMSMDSHLNNVIKTSLKMNSEDLEKVGDVDAKIGVGSPEQVKRAAKENWQYSDFSERIWADKAKLIKETRVVIEEGFARNKGAMDMATDLMTRMNVSHSNALRVVRTEFNHLSNQASLEEYKANGIKKYKFVAAIDNRTCSVCHELNGKEFNVADARVGVNFPPIHPNCRSVTVPVIDWEDEDQWDYSKIELDDAELAEIKASDSESVIRRAEQAEKREQIERDFEVDVHRQLEAIDKIETKINQLEDMQKRMDGEPMTIARAVIAAERLEEIVIDIKEKELEVIKLQDCVSKLDDTVPKPEQKRINALETDIEEAKTRRADRQKKALPDAEIIEQTLPQITVEKSEPTAEDAIAPKSSIGKTWVRGKRGVERMKERFVAHVESFEIVSGLRLLLPANHVEPKETSKANEQAETMSKKSKKNAKSERRFAKAINGTILINIGQMKYKQSYHGPEFGFDVRKDDGRQMYYDLITETLTHPIEVRRGKFRQYDAFFYRGNHNALLIVNAQNGEFITMFPMNDTNKWFFEARKLFLRFT